jgi:hypothetical protein
MATNELIRKRAQAAIEVTRGTAVPIATRIMYATINPSYDRAITEFQDQSGTYFARRRVAYQRPVIGFSGTDLATFEDLPWWFQLGIKGEVAGVTDGGTPPAYTYAFQPSGTADDIKSITLQHNEAGNPYISSQVMLNSWTLRVQPDSEGAWMFDFEALGRDWTTLGSYTSLSDRTTEAIYAPGTKVYLDTTTMGATQLTGQVIDFSLTCNLNLHMKGFMEDQLSWSPNRVGRGARTFDATVTMEFDNDTEFALYRATTATLRKLRIEREGSQIHGTIVTNKKATVDMFGYWRSIGFGDREGNLTATFGLQGFYNATAGYDVKATVVNDLASLP